MGVGRQPGQATGRQGGREGVGQQGGRGTARRTNAGNTRDSLRRKRRALAKVQHADTAQRAVCSGTAPMSRVHDKADERVHGTWVGRSLELR